ncbi:hypothetical protein NQ318_019881 [Aromia moschata]|uniref:UDP-glucuronosyltransferase n=1 Tax=Aromia moschata TaxID=1265417 RepID=A0AAV8YLR9_9CUCU|nr:hypothetical protein NQ318_019881 [Aromia moschata]
MITFVLLPLTLSAVSTCAFAANILLAYDLPSPSHQIWNYALAEGLIAKGHNVTMLGPFTDRGKSSDKYHPLMVEGVLETLGKSIDMENFVRMSPLPFMKMYVEYTTAVCNYSYQTEGVKTLLNYPSDFKFDLIILDVTLSTCFYPLIQRFGYPPTIGETAFLLPSFVSSNFGNHLHPSYLPTFFVDYADDMGFFQRVANYLFTYGDAVVRQRYEMREMEEIVKPIFGTNVDSMSSLMRRMTLLLCNLNPALTYPQPLPPNIIPVGGLHVREAKKLPADLASVMDNATDGVILFCLGTNINSANLDLQTRRTLLSAFSKLKQTVLWKFETDDIDDLPKNVIVRKWLPQNDILGHHNTRLFISHGGALSTYEAIYHSVPIVGMPFFIDQRITVKNLVKRHIAKKLDFRSITMPILLHTINEVLTDPIYKKNMKEVSRRFRDQPQTPLDRAVFYAEYAMRHNGAQFLNPKSRDLPFLVSSSADVIIFLLSLFATFTWLLFKGVKRISLCLRRPTNKEKLN